MYDDYYTIFIRYLLAMTPLPMFSLCIDVHIFGVSDESAGDIPIDWTDMCSQIFRRSSNEIGGGIDEEYMRLHRKPINAKRYFGSIDHSRSVNPPRKTDGNTSSNIAKKSLPDIEDIQKYLPPCLGAINNKVLGVNDIIPPPDVTTLLSRDKAPPERSHPNNQERYLFYRNLREIGYGEDTVAHYVRSHLGYVRKSHYNSLQCKDEKSRGRRIYLDEALLQDQIKAVKYTYKDVNMAPGCNYASNSGLCPYGVTNNRKKCGETIVGPGRRIIKHNPANACRYRIQRDFR